MDHVLLRATDRLALALQQAEHALRNLRQVQTWADRYGHPHLGLGTLDLAQRLARLNEDLQSLVSVVRTQGRAAES